MNSDIKPKEIIELCLAKNLLFACYNLPNSSICHFVIQKDAHVHDFSLGNLMEYSAGFVVMPFNKKSKSKAVFIQADYFGSAEDIDTEEIHKLDSNPITENDCPKSMERVDYLNHMETIIQKLKDDDGLEKIVFSRILTIDKPQGFTETSVFERFSKAYNSAFSYVLNIPGQGRWMGATPETLIQVEDSSLKTMALAGTQKLNGEALESIRWSEKDKEEHFYVSDYIEKSFHRHGVENYHKEGPFTVASAQVIHLKTAYQFHLEKLQGKLGDFVESLHPTPAVGGYPRKYALEYLKEIESHDREYYSGFLGPINIHDSSRLFVNLRCMQLGKSHLSLYIGGGITAQSIADKEWEETCLKAQTVLSAL